MSRKHDFKELQKRYTSATVANQKVYSFPAAYKIIIEMRLIDGFSSRKLKRLLPQYFASVIPYPENHTTGLPAWYIPWGHYFDLFKIPDDAYQLQLKTVDWPTVITASTGITTYDSNKDDIIVNGMTAEGFDYLQMYEDGALWRVKFKSELKEAIDLDESAPDYEPVGRGFEASGSGIYVGEYWNEPFTWRSM